MTLGNFVEILSLIMGACYAYDSDWQEEEIKVSVRKRQRKKKKTHPSIIVEERSGCNSFVSVLDYPVRDSLHEVIDSLAASTTSSPSLIKSSLAMGSIVDMTPEEFELVIKHLSILHTDNEEHTTQQIRLCNFKTKNFLHTHKIRLEQKPSLQEVSCCPYNSGHTLQYDVWKFIPASGAEPNEFYIFHPFTGRYLAFDCGIICAKSQTFTWTVMALGKRRNLGFIRINCPDGELCMTDDKALVKNHRKITVCKQVHVSHLWEVIFTEMPHT